MISEARDLNIRVSLPSGGKVLEPGFCVDGVVFLPICISYASELDRYLGALGEEFLISCGQWENPSKLLGVGNRERGRWEHSILLQTNSWRVIISAWISNCQWIDKSYLNVWSKSLVSFTCLSGPMQNLHRPAWQKQNILRHPCLYLLKTNRILPGIRIKEDGTWRSCIVHTSHACLKKFVAWATHTRGRLKPNMKQVLCHKQFMHLHMCCLWPSENSKRTSCWEKRAALCPRH